MDIKEAAHNDAAAETDAEIAAPDGGGSVRRRVLVAGLSGTALSLLPLLAGRAGAGGAKPTASTTPTGNSSGGDTFSTTRGTSDAGATIGGGGGYSGTGDSTNATTGDTTDVASLNTGGSTVDTEAATTTTAPPKRPDPADVALLSFAQRLELTIRDLYNHAIEKKVFDGAMLETVKTIGEDHDAYSQSISGLLGRVAPNTRIDAMFTAMQTDFEGSAASVAAAARALENTAVATHIDLVSQLLGIDGSALIASMLVVEARHATVLATFAGVTGLDEQLASAVEALSPSDYL